jgi:hypothetical protein
MDRAHRKWTESGKLIALIESRFNNIANVHVVKNILACSVLGSWSDRKVAENKLPHEAVPWLRRFDAGLSELKSPGSILVQSLWDLWWVKRHLDKVSLPVLQFCPVSIILPMLCTNPHLHIAVNRRTNGRNVRTFQNPIFFRKSWRIR